MNPNGVYGRNVKFGYISSPDEFNVIYFCMRQNAFTDFSVSKKLPVDDAETRMGGATPESTTTMVCVRALGGGKRPGCCKQPGYWDPLQT